MPEILEARPAEWIAALNRLETTLGHSLALADEPAAENSERSEPVAGPALRRLDERLAALEAALDRAERSAAETDALLAAEAERARHCVAVLGASRQRLAEWSARAV